MQINVGIAQYNNYVKGLNSIKQTR